LSLDKEELVDMLSKLGSYFCGVNFNISLLFNKQQLRFRIKSEPSLVALTWSSKFSHPS